MRYVSVVLIPAEEGLHPIDRKLAEDPELSRELMHNINLLDDGTTITLYQVAGDPDRVEAHLTSSDVLEYNVAETDRSVNAYVHFVPNDTVRELLELLQCHELILDLPLEYTERGGLRITLVGEAETFREVRSEVPDSVRLKLEQTGEYEPETYRLFSQLTPRQQETLRAAIEAGYYEVPRKATHVDIAEKLDRTDATVGEHLRKIEATVLSQIVP